MLPTEMGRCFGPGCPPGTSREATMAGQSGRTLTRTRRREARMPTSLAHAQERFLASHAARNHSTKLIEHYQATFQDFDRFLAATRRRKSVEVLTSEAMEAFATWLRETPLRRAYRGTTVRSVTGAHGRMKD